MTPRKVALVCEGSSDVAVITSVMTEVARGAGVALEVHHEYPQRDATSGRWDRVGWTNVRSWCKREAARYRKGRATIASKLAFLEADAIFIHLDGDVSALLSSALSQKLTADGITGRLDRCAAAILAWLEEDALKALTRPVIAVMQTETWLLATFPSGESPLQDSPADLDAVSDVERRLLTAGYAPNSHNPSRMLKSYDLYLTNDAYTPRLIAHLDAAVQQSNSLRHLVNEVLRPPV